MMKQWSWTRGGIALGLALIWSIGVYAEEVISIGTILLDPTSFHRQPVVLQGIVQKVKRYESRDFSNRPLCLQGFTLEDETGAIEVVSISRCQVGEEKAVLVTVGEPVRIHATIEAPPDNLKDARGAEFGFRAMATKIMRVKK